MCVFVCHQLVGGDDDKGERGLHPLDIDAYWLQRNLSKHYDDPMVAQSKSQEVLSILQEATDDRGAERKLVTLLGFDQFSFIRLLREHRQISKCGESITKSVSAERASLNQ